jgi:DNA-binding NtrC family response regulator
LATNAAPFTNAVTRRVGRFEQANGGASFLDEIAELPLALQAKLLRAIQEKTIERLGSNQQVPVDFRLITATARDLGGLVATGKFREDFYYRLNVSSALTGAASGYSPTRAEVPQPVGKTSDDSARRAGWDFRLCLAGERQELENVTTRAIVLAPGGVITPECIQFSDARPHTPSCWLEQAPFQEGYWNGIRMVEGLLLTAALNQASGNKAEAARILGIQRRLLYEKMSEFGIS